MKIYSEPGQGTAVRLYLPRSLAQAVFLRKPYDEDAIARALKSALDLSV